ncbi:hypothetical protein SARC_07314 [Sphaeroforma arctica JP610]|uniref:Uncharacterized protein n=1 Tax=Sphaeroforma arctica JP610 TaxID=667725 RepID=A0A0L0FWJ1_9EUKA|nr:hypothetical protein SARC_07314 [Sphaeroforma arctica JP610]KNC80323.1 hypothetical protein SARC_07314 [Sphaeroforma arctica JP610]|eukprot:XP_014154225.1 hypothetical protein SARC_07314 [Sphaeroforma arctica JP610]
MSISNLYSPKKLVTCSIAAIALAGSSTFAYSINRRQAQRCASGTVHLDGWVFTRSCGNDAVQPTFMIDVPIGDTCFTVPAAPPLEIPFYTTVVYTGTGYDVIIFLDEGCVTPFVFLPENYRLGDCVIVPSSIDDIYIVGSCSEGAGEADQIDDGIGSDAQPILNKPMVMASEEAMASEEVMASGEVAASEEATANDEVTAGEEAMISEEVTVSEEVTASAEVMASEEVIGK